jgi:hypothetical protein
LSPHIQRPRSYQMKWPTSVDCGYCTEVKIRETSIAADIPCMDHLEINLRPSALHRLVWWVGVSSNRRTHQNDPVRINLASSTTATPSALVSLRPAPGFGVPAMVLEMTRRLYEATHSRQRAKSPFLSTPKSRPTVESVISPGEPSSSLQTHGIGNWHSSS